MKNNFLKARWVRKRHMDGWHRRHGSLFSQTTPSVGEPIWRGRRRKGCCERNTKSAHGKRRKPGERLGRERSCGTARGVALRGRSVTRFPGVAAAPSPGGAALRQRCPPGRSVPAAQHGPGPAPGTNIDATLSRIKQTESHPSHRGRRRGGRQVAARGSGRAVPCSAGTAAGTGRGSSAVAAPPPSRAVPCHSIPRAAARREPSRAVSVCVEGTPLPPPFRLPTSRHLLLPPPLPACGAPGRPAGCCGARRDGRPPPGAAPVPGARRRPRPPGAAPGRRLRQRGAPMLCSASPLRAPAPLR